MRVSWSSKKKKIPRGSRPVIYSQFDWMMHSWEISSGGGASLGRGLLAPSRKSPRASAASAAATPMTLPTTDVDPRTKSFFTSSTLWTGSSRWAMRS